MSISGSMAMALLRLAEPGKRSAADAEKTKEKARKENEAFRLYSDMAGFDRRPDAKVSVWHGAKEPNMKKAVAAIRNIYPSAEDRAFDGLGHGDIIGDPERMAMEIERFIEGEPSDK